MSSDKNNDKKGLHRTLKSRHMSMIAIGGSIGTGLFLASGSAFSSAGPGGALTAYIVMGILVYFLMTSLGEMATLLPVSGSFQTYAKRFVDPAFSFALGWNYWFSWAITVAAEMVAGSIIIKYWFPNSNGTLCSVFFIAILFTLNFVSARAFAETEYWLAGIKVVTVIVFLITGTLMIFGILGGKSPGFSNWVLNDNKGHVAPFIGGASSVIFAFMVAGFSFIGTELVGVAAGESENPEVNVPKAINSVFWRILLFYLCAIIVIGFLIPFTNPNLLRNNVTDVAFSPFTMVFKRLGFSIAASIMNAVILTAVISCGNSGLYASTRMLYSMAKEGSAPKWLGVVNKRGVPTNALYVTTLVACTAFFSTMVGTGKIYLILYNLSAISGFFIWLGISVCHLRFRKAYIAQGRKLEDLKYRAKWYPFAPIAATVLSILVILGSNYWVFQANVFSWFDFITSYGWIVVFIGLYVGYKIVFKTKMVPLNECDFTMKEYK